MKRVGGGGQPFMNHTQSQASSGNSTKINTKVTSVDRVLSGQRPIVPPGEKEESPASTDAGLWEINNLCTSVGQAVPDDRAVSRRSGCA